jgi:hypothetical protein
MGNVMFDRLMKMFGHRVEPVAQPKKTKPKKTAKEIANEKNEPYVSILKVNLDPNNPRYGSFELDWNTAFVARLSMAGYKGDKEEDIVDQWFQDVCRHVVLETYEQEQANIAEGDNIVRYINRKDAGNGRSEVS